jgi:hypothetical protein
VSFFGLASFLAAADATSGSTFPLPFTPNKFR